MRLYLVRHAESTNNVIYGSGEENTGHTPDPEITEKGHRQAALLGEHFSMPGNEPRQHPFESSGAPDYDVTHIYCSLMSRTILTAGYIADACGLNLEALEDVFERKGVYHVDSEGNESGAEGPGRRYFEERFPKVKLPDTVTEKGWWNRPVEENNEFIERVGQSLQNIASRHGDTDDSVVLVAHGDYIDQCINELMGVERHPRNYEHDWVANWVFHNTSISRVDMVNGSRNIVYLNRVDHLLGDLVSW